MSITASVVVVVDADAFKWMDTLEADITALVARYADLIVQEAQRLAPVQTGQLRNSIKATLSGMVSDISAGEGLPDGRAQFMEYGTRTVAAHPYLRPSFEEYAPAFIRDLELLLSGQAPSQSP